MRTIYIITIFLILSGCTFLNRSHKNYITIEPPEKIYGQLFYDVQNSAIYEFTDSKTFCDAIPKYFVKEIVRKYRKLPNKSDTNILKQFVLDNFDLPYYKSAFTDKSEISHHIHILWDYLTHFPDIPRSGTLIPLPKKYVIPGGRFREVYYWDSYFTMLGLQVENKTDLIRDMIDNFSYLINSFGHVPNGNRTYYLSRSQPPFFSLMVSLLASIENNNNAYLQYSQTLRKEYYFWMDGQEKLSNRTRSYKRVVMLADGSILNRYWDNEDTPRPEAYREDKTTASRSKVQFGRKENDVYRNIRAAAESGWDFSSRWLKDTSTLISIHTVDIVPVDLNCLMCHLEKTLSKCYQLRNMKDSTAYFSARAMERIKKINSYCWNATKNFYMDYDFEQKKQTPVLSLAGVYPLFFQIADSSQALKVVSTIKSLFIKDGGVVTTIIRTGQQWDAPNGWAPLHWITIQGLRNYNYNELAQDIARRWMNTNKKIYYQTGKMLEKYDVEDTTRLGGGGEYPNQDGFGWTNGVFQRLTEDYHL